MKVEQFVLNAIANAINKESSELDLADSVTALGLDSLAILYVVAQIEAVYGIELSIEQIVYLGKAETIGQLLSRLQQSFDNGEVLDLL